MPSRELGTGFKWSVELSWRCGWYGLCKDWIDVEVSVEVNQDQVPKLPIESVR